MSRIIDWLSHENIEYIEIESINPMPLTNDLWREVYVNVKNCGRTIGKCIGALKTANGEYPLQLLSEPVAHMVEFKSFNLMGGKITELYGVIPASEDLITVSIKFGKKEWKKRL